MNEYTIEVTETFKIRAESREAAVALLVSDPNAAGRPDVDWLDVRREVIDSTEFEQIIRIVPIDENTSLDDKISVLALHEQRGSIVRVSLQREPFDPETEESGKVKRTRGGRWQVGGLGGAIFSAHQVKQMRVL